MWTRSRVSPRSASPRRCARVSSFVQTLLDRQTYVSLQHLFLIRKIARRFGACHLSQKGPPMFTAEQYRAKASEYAKLAGIANGPNEVLEFQQLERSFTELADNAHAATPMHRSYRGAACPQQRE